MSLLCRAVLRRWFSWRTASNRQVTDRIIAGGGANCQQRFSQTACMSAAGQRVGAPAALTRTIRVRPFHPWYRLPAGRGQPAVVLAAHRRHPP